MLAVPEATVDRPGSRMPLGRFVSGIAKLDGRLLLILDIGVVLSEASRDDVEAKAPTPEPVSYTHLTLPTITE